MPAIFNKEGQLMLLALVSILCQPGSLALPPLPPLPPLPVCLSCLVSS